MRKCFVDVTKIFMLGQRAVLQCALSVHRIFEKTDTHYLLNKVFMDDYCVWLQSLGGAEEGYADEVLRAIGKECSSVKASIEKSDMGDLCIVAIEGELENESEGGDPRRMEQDGLSRTLEGLTVTDEGLAGDKTRAPLIEVIGEASGSDAGSSGSSGEDESGSDSEYETDTASESDKIEEEGREDGESDSVDSDKVT